MLSTLSPQSFTFRKVSLLQWTSASLGGGGCPATAAAAALGASDINGDRGMCVCVWRQKADYAASALLHCPVAAGGSQ